MLENRGMPLFEFVCPRCQHRFEDLVKAEETPACPKCQQAGAVRQLSAHQVGRAGVEAAPAAGCGRCGDPRGPGACAFN